MLAVNTFTVYGAQLLPQCFTATNITYVSIRIRVLSYPHCLLVFPDVTYGVFLMSSCSAVPIASGRCLVSYARPPSAEPIPHHYSCSCRM